MKVTTNFSNIYLSHIFNLCNEHFCRRKETAVSHNFRFFLLATHTGATRRTTSERPRRVSSLQCHITEYPATSKLDTQLSLLCAFLTSVALRTTNRHTVCFLCYVKPCVSKWIREYSLNVYADTTEYLRIHLFLGVTVSK